jgi:hypothetical protein
VNQDGLRSQFVDRHAERIGRVHVHPVLLSQCQQFDKQNAALVIQPDNPEMLLLSADPVLAQQHLLHDVVHIL